MPFPQDPENQVVKEKPKPTSSRSRSSSAAHTTRVAPRRHPIPSSLRHAHLPAQPPVAAGALPPRAGDEGVDAVGAGPAGVVDALDGDAVHDLDGHHVDLDDLRLRVLVHAVGAPGPQLVHYSTWSQSLPLTDAGSKPWGNLIVPNTQDTARGG